MIPSPDGISGAVVQVPEQAEIFPLMKMEERLEVLKECGRRGWVYKVGSMPNIPGFVKGEGMEYARNVFENYLVPELEKTGVMTVAQKAGADEGIGMNQEPNYHPDEGLIMDGSTIIIKPGMTAEEVEGKIAGELDFHPGALPMWQIIQENADLLKKKNIQVLKTQLTSTNCARFHLSPEVGQIQDTIMSSMSLTHLSKAARIAPVVCVSLDNPNADVLEGLRHDMEVMLGMSWDDGGTVADRGLLDALNIVPALHSCEIYEMPWAMKLGIGLVHGDFAKIDPGKLLRGDTDIIRNFISGNGLIGVGVIPQSGVSQKMLAEEMGILIGSGKDSEERLVEDLRGRHQEVVEKIISKYQGAVDYVSQVTGLDGKTVRDQCLLSYTCGFGGNKSIEVSRYALELADEISDLLRGVN